MSPDLGLLALAIVGFAVDGAFDGMKRGRWVARAILLLIGASLTPFLWPTEPVWAVAVIAVVIFWFFSIVVSFYESFVRTSLGLESGRRGR